MQVSCSADWEPDYQDGNSCCLAQYRMAET